jgi:hypothetical protein
LAHLDQQYVSAGNLGIKPPEGSKAWIEARLISIAKAAQSGLPAKTQHKHGKATEQPAVKRDLALAVQALMSVARLNGHIVEKKQTLAGKVDLNKLRGPQLQELLASSLDQIAPGERQRIQRLVQGISPAEDEPEDIIEGDPADE